ncbi:hypothetical protein Q3G72_003816 [Acer saccharum]|nr:hypothetical protein Q3G72_003816 [Acer saccharum]
MARTLTSHENHHTNNALQPQNEGCGNVDEKKNDWVDKMGSALMVVASLIATMAFQVAVNPLGGVWQDNISQSGGSPPGSLGSRPHTAGKSIFADTDPALYSLFLIYDTTVTAMAFTYAFAIYALSGLKSISGVAVRSVFSVWYGLMGLLFLVHTILLIVKIKYVKKSIRQRRQPSGNMTGMNISNEA